MRIEEYRNIKIDKYIYSKLDSHVFFE
ncbi:hypothetical protein CNEO2_890009 [Clostridium neonatale]|nr:hypothetical protein CNEO2_890009 [Clostridium neonatale]